MKNCLITTLKDSVDNPNLKILTPYGLYDYYTGRYINGMHEQGLALTGEQIAAIETFVAEISANDTINAVKNYWPFIGTRDSVGAVKVPLIGGKLFDFADSFSDFKYKDDDIIGFAKCPSVQSVTTEDLCGDNCWVPCVSVIRNASDLPKQYPVKAIGTNSVWFNAQQNAVKTNTMGIGIVSNPVSGQIFPSSMVPSDYNSRGNTYLILGLNDRSGSAYYCRYARHNNGNPVYAVGTDIGSQFAFTPMTAAQKAESLLSLDYTYYGLIDALTGFATFNRLPSEAEMVTFVNAMKKLNIAMGKEVAV